MPSLVQKVPTALLSLMEMKAGGVAPNALLDEVRGVVDFTDLYGIDKRFALRETINTPALGWSQFTTTLVPEGQVWRVLSASLVITATAGGTCGGSVGFAAPIDPGPGAAPTYFGLTPDRAIAPVASSLALSASLVNLWWGPRYSGAVFIAHNSANVASAEISLLVERFRI